MRFGKLIGFGIWSVVLSGLGIFFYQMHESGREERELRERVARLMTRERVARIYVAKIVDAEGSGPPTTHLRWSEEGAPGTPTGGRELKLPGREIHVKALQIIFDPQRTAEGDPLRGKSLNLFSAIYSEEIAPKNALRLDFHGDDGEGRSKFEDRLWKEFKQLMTDEEFAKSRGVATAQGKAVSKEMVEGKEYRITLSATGQLDLMGPFEPDTFVKKNVK